MVVPRAERGEGGRGNREHSLVHAHFIYKPAVGKIWWVCTKHASWVKLRARWILLLGRVALNGTQ